MAATWTSHATWPSPSLWNNTAWTKAELLCIIGALPDLHERVNASMKKYMGLLIAVFCVLLALCAQAEETSACTLVYGKETVEWPMLTDGDPSTVWTGKKGKSVQLTL